MHNWHSVMMNMSLCVSLQRCELHVPVVDWAARRCRVGVPAATPEGSRARGHLEPFVHRQGDVQEARQQRCSAARDPHWAVPHLRTGECVIVVEKQWVKPHSARVTGWGFDSQVPVKFALSLCVCAHVHESEHHHYFLRLIEQIFNFSLLGQSCCFRHGHKMNICQFSVDPFRVDLIFSSLWNDISSET